MKGLIFFIWLIFKIWFLRWFWLLVIVILNWFLSLFLIIFILLFVLGLNVVIVGDVFLLLINKVKFNVFKVFFNVFLIV